MRQKKRGKIACEEKKNKLIETIVIVVTIDNANVQMLDGIVRTVEYAYVDVYVTYLYIGSVVASRANDFVFPLSLFAITRFTVEI